MFNSLKRKICVKMVSTPEEDEESRFCQTMRYSLKIDRLEKRNEEENNETN